MKLELMNLFFKDVALPRIVFVPWIITRLWLSLLSFFYHPGLFASKKQWKEWHSTICIEAGERGWESIEFKELYQSACEYVGASNVIKLVVFPDKSYVRQVATLLSSSSITHYVYDPRTGSQSWLRGLWQSLSVATLLHQKSVTPIALLTDLSIRRWRAQSSMVTAHRGLVVSFMSSRVMAPIFPHSRLHGPSLMPFSMRTQERLNEMVSLRKANAVPKAIFTGSLYEPRTSILKAVESAVKAKGDSFEILGRPLGSARIGDDEYWARLVDADIVFSTAVQAEQSGTDWNRIPHFIYRYLEVLAAGSLLIAEDVPGVRRFFTPGIHFVGYDNADDAADKIHYYLNNESERKEIAQNGKSRADSFIQASVFWMSIDACLKNRSLM
jgi:glycosyltransferase involved in cell wall biosynthesis